VTWAGRAGVTKASNAETEHAAMASDDVLPPRVSLELLARRRSDFVFFGLTELSVCRPVSLAARNLSTADSRSDSHTTFHCYINLFNQTFFWSYSRLDQVP